MPASTRPHHDCRQEAEGHGLAEKPPWDSRTQHSRISANYRPAEARWWEVSTREPTTRETDAKRFPHVAFQQQSKGQRAGPTGRPPNAQKGCIGRQGGPGLGRRPGTDNEENDNAADLVAHFAVALGRAKSRRTTLLDMVGEDGAQRIQNRNPLKALPELTAAEHEGARQFLFRLLYLMYRERRTGCRVTESDATHGCFAVTPKIASK